MNIFFNGQSREVESDITVAELLDQLELASSRVAVEVNLEVAPRTQHENLTLRDGDQIEVVTLAGGG